MAHPLAFIGLPGLLPIIATSIDFFGLGTLAELPWLLGLNLLTLGGILLVVGRLLWQGRSPDQPQSLSSLAATTLLGTYTLSQLLQGILPGASWWQTGLNGLSLGVAIALLRSQNHSPVGSPVTQDLEQRNRELELAVSQSTAELGVQNQRLNEILTELQRMQVHLIQLEKMSTLGQMVAGISHEIQNPINFISGNLPHVEAYIQDLTKVLQTYQTQVSEQTSQMQSVLAEVELDFILEDLPRVIESIKSGTDRIQNLVDHLETFYRPDATGMQLIHLEDNIESTLALLQNRYKKRIEIVRQFEPIPPVECYANQLNQVLMTLLGNAIEVLLEHNQEGAKQIAIATRPMGSDRVAIMVADNGRGMPLEVQTRLFEPFFTTKPTGVGTGLGLSIAHQIVTEIHQGRLYCCSAPGEGTTFIVELPIRQQRSGAIAPTNLPTLPTETTILADINDGN